MKRVGSLLIVGAALAGSASVAHADVYLDVPVRFLGGPIKPAVPQATPPAVPAGTPISIAMPPPTEADIVGYPCDIDDPADCIGWREPVDFAPPPGERGEDDPPFPQGVAAADAAPVAAPAPADAATVAGGLLSPAPEAWLPWQTPMLRWRAEAGATHYNVQVHRGERLVTSIWTRATRVRVPAGILKQGRTYVWTVWPGRGTRAMPTYGEVPIGRATFQVTLRPRLVFRPVPKAPGRVAVEVRPHIPFAKLRLSAPAGLRPGRVPATLILDGNGRTRLAIPPRVAERLDVALTDRGPAPPLGLRAP